MARQVQVVLTSDLTGDAGEDIETVSFGVDGVNYEIDLSAKEAEKLRHNLGMYIDAGRKVGRSGKPVSTVKVQSDAKAVRAWAEANGYSDKLPARGRIPQEIRDAYAAAGN